MTIARISESGRADQEHCGRRVGVSRGERVSETY